MAGGSCGELGLGGGVSTYSTEEEVRFFITNNCNLTNLKKKN